MSRLIDADALRNEWLYKTGAFEPNDILDSIDYQPTIDAVQVVRCGECRWWDKTDKDSLYGYCHACKHAHFSKNWEISIYRTYKSDWFCAGGERRSGQE